MSINEKTSSDNQTIFNLNKRLIFHSATTLNYCRTWSMRFASRSIQKCLGIMGDFLTGLQAHPLLNVFYEDMIALLQSLLSAQENNDFVLLADILEINVIPALNTIQQTLLQAEPAISFVDLYEQNIAALKNPLANRIPKAKDYSAGSYLAEPSTIGSNILKYQRTGDVSFYLHSNNNPYEEARLWASAYSEEDCLSYTVLGFGMGYHIRALLQYDRRFEVTVFETSMDVLSLAFTYEIIKDILTNPRFHLKYSADPKELSSLLDGTDSKLLIHYPSMEALKDSPVKTALRQYFIKLDSLQSHEKYLKWNFYYNTKHGHPCACSLQSKFQDKTVILLAGGPSLEASLDFLKKLPAEDDSYILLSVGTSYRGLVSQGIIPDYVMITDAGDRIFHQLKGIPENKTSLLYLSTASDRAVNEFTGNKYILYQNGYPEAEDYASAHNLTLFETGGSVSTTAIDFSLRMGCKKLITLGLDLAYPAGRCHSFRSEKISKNGDANLQVPAVGGGTVPTTNVLTIYRKWIEERLGGKHGLPNDVEVVNISDGAYIQNAKNLPTSALQDYCI